MGMKFPELSLNSIHVHHPKTITEFLRELSMIKDNSVKSTKLEEYIKQLQDEMRKIDAFKRELPLSMHLLNDGNLSPYMCVYVDVYGFWIWVFDLRTGF